MFPREWKGWASETTDGYMCFATAHITARWEQCQQEQNQRFIQLIVHRNAWANKVSINMLPPCIIILKYKFHILNRAVITYAVIINSDFITACEILKLSQNYICISKTLMGREGMPSAILFQNKEGTICFNQMRGRRSSPTPSSWRALCSWLSKQFYIGVLALAVFKGGWYLN